MSGYDLAVLTAAFQPLRRDDLATIRDGLEQARRLLIVLESEGAARRPDRTPFTLEERAAMIRACLGAATLARVTIVGTPDPARPGELDAAVQDLVRQAEPAPGARVVWIGATVSDGAMSGDAVRRAYFDADSRAADAFLRGAARDQLPAPVVGWLTAFRQSPDYGDLAAEQAFADRYRSAWRAAPYPPVFVTADAMVVHGDQVLVIRRKSRPGQGLWALPGGFLEQDEFILDAAIRELAEETGLAVKAETLRRCAIATRVFDAPWRDIRGRMVTHATLFRLEAGASPPPAVQGGDDAAEAVWVPLASLRRDTLFGDHFQVVQTLLAAERALEA